MKGLKKLDEVGHPYTDLKLSNVLLCEGDRVVIIDDVAGNDNLEAFSLSSRKEFGTFFYNALVKPEYQLPEQRVPDSTWINTHRDLLAEEFKSVAPFIEACWSDRTMADVSWEFVVNTLYILRY